MDYNKPFTSTGTKHYNRTVQERNEEIEAIELSEPEIKYALWIGKQHKWYKERRGENTDFKARNEDLNISVK